ncbi:hypothetical protein FD28_GL000022 [Levilactobacillus hammesii DSM 16381]|uniref:Uncharacterized protein n=1 Tax=Levilactobacillus hammesii DSM 16381 TaxID=1423753 RepID=A0A0R1UY61_9LACO|nr:hypothetical protein FD28_GL000022 [Levilactobacillus hammesii DSM 16381]
MSDSLRQIKANKDKNSQALEYEQLIRNLVSEKSELEDIANEYKQELEKISISNDDIESLHQTVETTFKIIMGAGIIKYDSDEEQATTTQSLNALLALLNSDTLRTLQLLGYNYKEAIGAPLTEVTSRFILNKLSSETTKVKRQRK